MTDRMTDTMTSPSPTPPSLSCDEVGECLHEHAFGELEPQMHAAVAAHLGTCGACAVAYCRLEAELRGITRAFAERPPARVRAALRDRVEREFAPSWWQRSLAVLRTPIPAYGVGVAVAAVTPLLLWAFAAGSPVADADVPVVTSPARIQGYDASAPLFDPSWS